MTDYIYNFWYSFLSIFNYNLELGEITEYIEQPTDLISELNELENNIDIENIEINTLKYLKIDLHKFCLTKIMNYIDKLLKEAFSKKDYDVDDILFNSNLKTLLTDITKLNRINEIKEILSWQIIKMNK
jgi:hypothetical protein